MDKIIYTDGSCRADKGIGAFSYVILDNKDAILKEEVGLVIDTTNNRMELTAAITALINISCDDKIKLYTDSMYLINGITIWIKNWKKREWKTATGKKNDIKNRDLWEKLDKLNNSLNIEWLYVKGHSGNYFNELCDKRAFTLLKEYFDEISRKSISE